MAAGLRDPQQVAILVVGERDLAARVVDDLADLAADARARAVGSGPVDDREPAPARVGDRGDALLRDAPTLAWRRRLQRVRDRVAVTVLDAGRIAVGVEEVGHAIRAGDRPAAGRIGVGVLAQ